MGNLSPDHILGAPPLVNEYLLALITELAYCGLALFLPFLKAQIRARLSFKPYLSKELRWIPSICLYLFTDKDMTILYLFNIYYNVLKIKSCLYIFKFLNFEIIIDLHAVFTNNTEIMPS